MFLKVLCFVLGITIIILITKIINMKKALGEISNSFKEHISQETNTLITTTTGDRHICRLVSEINNELKEFRKKQLQYTNGDIELKEAVTNISHDLRTPLTAINGYLELLEQEEINDKASDYLAKIRNRTEAMKQLTEELFKFTITMQAENLELEEVNVKEVLEETILSFYGVIVEKEIEPEIVITDNEVIRMLNKVALARAFSNIISNAVKYSDGDLKIELRDNGEICFSNYAVKLNEVQAQKLCNRFYTVETARNSTGLGLSIANSLVKQMNGELEVEYKNSRLIIAIQFNRA